MTILNKLSGCPRRSISQVAVFYDPESMFYLNENLGIKEDYVNHIICELSKSGVLYDIYNLNDIDKIQLDKYKLLVFLDAFKIRSEIKQVVDASEAYKVWIHAPGYENARNYHDIECTVGMKLAETDCDMVEYKGKVFGFSRQIKPMFEVLDGEYVLAYYADGCKVAVALKGKNIYSAVGNIPYILWHEIERICGVHSYTSNGTAVYGDSRFICTQNPFSEKCCINLPEDMRFIELFDGGEYRSDNCMLEYNAPRNATKLFAVVQAKKKNELQR